MIDINQRPDKVNIERLFGYGHRVGYGESEITITWHNGYIAKWRAVRTTEGSQAPLEREKRKMEED